MYVIALIAMTALSGTISYYSRELELSLSRIKVELDACRARCPGLMVPPALARPPLTEAERGE